VVSPFEGQVHAFMPAILLRMTGLDAFDGDAQTQPPDGELGEVEQRVGRGEGNAVVRAHADRQAAPASESRGRIRLRLMCFHESTEIVHLILIQPDLESGIVEMDQHLDVLRRAGVEVRRTCGNTT
jgi:hypothetical protein